MIGFIGLGAAGGNIADEARNSGFPALAINYSQKDLDSLEYILEDERLRLVGSEGVGKNREEAIRLIRGNWESVVSFVGDNFSTPSIEVIIVSFATGGGSGSGMAPILLDILIGEFTEKTFVASPILPDTSEVIVNQVNCIKASEELSSLDICTIPIDNEQVHKSEKVSGKHNLYTEINKTFVKEIKSLLSYTEQNSKHGILDQKDLHTLFKTRGVMVISSIDITHLTDKQINLSTEGIVNEIKRSWEASIFVPPHYDRIVRAGFVFDGQESLMGLLNVGEVFSCFSSGMPLDLFEGYYRENSGKIYTILSGLSWYRGRLAKIEETVKAKQESTDNLLAGDGSYTSSLGSLSIHKNEKLDRGKRSVSDILSRYNR